MQKLIVKARPKIEIYKISNNSVRKSIYNLTIKPWFEPLILTFIILNIISMAMSYDGMDR